MIPFFGLCSKNECSPGQASGADKEVNIESVNIES